jgi:alginate O-acetyltransferase complex protein AlgI
MLFNSRVFLLVFLPIVYFSYWRLKSRNHRYAWLTLSGYVFYSFWDYRFCGLMLFSTLVSYFSAIWLDRAATPGKRRFFLVAPIATDLLLLAVFKYAGFALTTTSRLAQLLHVPLQLPSIHIILPIGISFYTFHTITYIVDCYRGVIKPTRNFLEFSCYVSLFSQLVAGPIVRFRQIEQDLETIDHARRDAGLNIGWSFFVLGLIEKVLIADTIAGSINPLFQDFHNLSTVSAWTCALGYSYQLYFDFSGYSSMAVGLGYLFGLRLPQNFNSPYKAINISDFWARWHISLSTVLRDYLYIPLGGNRHGTRNTYRNLMLTMLLGGLWHGANWTFVFWGIYHGMLLVFYRVTQNRFDRLPKLLRQALTFYAVMLGFIVFRCTGFRMAGTVLARMFTPHGGALPTGVISLVLALLAAAYWAHIGPNPFEMHHDWRGWRLAGLVVLFLGSMFFITAGHQSPFLYFQF